MKLCNLGYGSDDKFARKHVLIRSTKDFDSEILDLGRDVNEEVNVIGSYSSKTLSGVLGSGFSCNKRFSLLYSNCRAELRILFVRI